MTDSHSYWICEWEWFVNILPIVFIVYEDRRLGFMICEFSGLLLNTMVLSCGHRVNVIWYNITLVDLQDMKFHNASNIRRRIITMTKYFALPINGHRLTSWWLVCLHFFAFLEPGIRDRLTDGRWLPGRNVFHREYKRWRWHVQPIMHGILKRNNKLKQHLKKIIKPNFNIY